MGMHKSIERDPLLAGFYTSSDAVRLLRIANTAKVRGWLNGWQNSASGPIIRRDFDDGRTISFLDLMELKFVETFSQHVSAMTLRKAAQAARLEWKTTHPFAMNGPKYVTDRRRIIAQAAAAEGDTASYDMATGQLEMWSVIEASVVKGVVFDPKSQLARAWRPSEVEFPEIIVDPRAAFGQPSLDEFGIPTATLFRAWKAEGSIGSVARWFRVPDSSVASAVNFEISLAH